MRFSVRLRATPGNLPDHVAATVAELDRRTLPNDCAVDLGGSYWWLAEMDGKVVGFAGLRVLNGSTGFLCRAGVLTEARGKGIHKRMISARVRHARRITLTSLVTYTVQWNLASANALIARKFWLYQPRTPLHRLEGCIYFRLDL